MITPTNHVIARARFTLRGALALSEFLLYLSAKLGEDQKKVLLSGAGPLALWHDKSGSGDCITFVKKVR